MKEKKVRDSNLELMRVFCMVIIILSHYVYHGGLLFETLSVNQIFAQLLKIGGKLGVTCFVLISAYFLVDSEFSIKNIFRLCLQVTFYSIIVLIVKIVIGDGYSFKEVVKSIFAPIYDVYWFPTAYIGMYFCFPLLNIIVNKLGVKLLKVLVFFTVVFGFTHFCFLGSGFLYSNLTWFLYLYLWGAYIKKNCVKVLEKNAGLIAGISVLCIWGLSIILNLVGICLGNATIVKYAYYFSDITSPLIISAGVGMFVVFKNLKLRTNKWINYGGAITFSVYLLHDNPFFRDILWKDIFKTQKFYNANIVSLVGHMLIVVVSLFFVSALIEIIRKKAEQMIFNSGTMKRYISAFDNWLRYIGEDTK